MKNLTFFKGLLIGGFLSVSVWVVAISAMSSVLDTNTPTKEAVQLEIYANTPPS